MSDSPGGGASLFSPTTQEELSSWVQQCSSSGQTIPWMTDPQQWLGEQTSRNTLSLQQLNAVIDHAWQDLTITVEAGITISALQQVLAERQQFLPLDIPCPEQTTVAELICQNWYGSLSAGYGKVRDFLLGISAIDGQGRIFKSGGRVVKNVAGYDLHKFLIGSRGRLAIPVSASLKVVPSPESYCLREYRLKDKTESLELWKQLRMLPFDPAIFDWTENRIVRLGLTGSEVYCHAAEGHFDQLLGEFSDPVSDNQQDHVPTSQPWSKILLDLQEIVSKDRLLVRLAMTPDRSVTFTEQIDQLENLQAVGHVATGTVIVWGTSTAASQSWLAAALNDPKVNTQVLMGQAADSLQASNSAHQLYQKIRQNFDPEQVFAVS